MANLAPQDLYEANPMMPKKQTATQAPQMSTDPPISPDPVAGQPPAYQSPLDPSDLQPKTKTAPEFSFDGYWKGLQNEDIGDTQLLTADNTDWMNTADRAPEVTEEQTVQGQLNKLFSEGNPVLDYAKGLGTQYANTRGLLNSDIAAESGAQAVFQQALPIAQQDANTYAARAQQEAGFWQAAGLQAQQGTIASVLAAQDHMQQMAQLARQGDINSRLQLEQFGYNWELSEQENLHNLQLAALQGDVQAALALQQFGMDVEKMKLDNGYRLKLADIELRNALKIGQQGQNFELERISELHQNALEQIQAQADASKDVNSDGYGRDLQQNYLNAVERLSVSFRGESAAIWSTPGLTAAQQNAAIAKAWNNYLSDLNFLHDQYTKSPYWDQSWGQYDPGDMPTDPGSGGGDGGTPSPGPSPSPSPGPGPAPSPPDQTPDFPSVDDIYAKFGKKPNGIKDLVNWFRDITEYLGSLGITPEEWSKATGFNLRNPGKPKEPELPEEPPVPAPTPRPEPTPREPIPDPFDPQPETPKPTTPLFDDMDFR